MLTLGPMSGYDLKQRIEVSIGNFWNESYGQIYPTLKRLQEEGFVSAAEGGRAGRKVYDLTEAGRERLRVWLEAPVRQRVTRNELLLKLFFGRMAPVASMRNHLGKTREMYAADLLRYETVSAPMITARQSGKPGLPYYRMVLSYGIHEARMIVAWCDEALAALDALAMVPVDQVLVEGRSEKQILRFAKDDKKGIGDDQRVPGDGETGEERRRALKQRRLSAGR